MSCISIINLRTISDPPDKFIIQGRFDKLLFPLWVQVKTLNVLPQARAARSALKSFAPDITVAFRTQNEGYIAAFADVHPWALFTQGSDFINMAERHFLHRQLTAFAVRRADALLADCRRDINFARKYGLRSECEAPRGNLPAMLSATGGLQAGWPNCL